MDDPGILYAQILNSDALKHYYRLQALGRINYVLQRNHSDLMDFLRKTQSPDAFHELWTIDKQDELLLVMMEVMRLFLNFLNSVTTRTVSTRNLITKSYEGEPFLREYKNEVERKFTEVPLVGFIEDLRNYSQHYGLPFAGARMAFVINVEGEAVPDQAFSLRKSELLEENFKWKKGKAFLEDTSDEIKIDEIAESYIKIVDEFQAWMMKRLLTIHLDDLEWLYAANKIVNDAIDQDRRSAGTAV